MLGEVFAERYRIVGHLGEGGMGSVFEAEHLTLGRRVAIKVLHPEHAKDDSFRQRFEREAKMLSALSHPNVVTVTDFGIHEDSPFLAMELVPGQTLASMMGSLPRDRALEILRQLLRGVGHAHAAGLVHRDLKPQNVLVQTLEDGSDHVFVLDFGLARAVEGGATVTQSGLVVGTPAYMSPEQATGGRADARSDVYSLGIVGFELLARRHPFPTKEPSELLRAHLLTPPPTLADATGETFPDDLEALLARALAKEPPARFEDASAMLDALERAAPRVSLPSSGITPAAADTTDATKAATPAAKTPTPEPADPRYDRDEQEARVDAVAPKSLPPPKKRGLRRRSPPLWIGGLGLVLLIAGAVAFVAYDGRAPSEATAGGEAPPSHEPEELPEGRPVPPTETPGPTPVLAPEPELPPVLARVRAKLDEGRTPSEDELGRLGLHSRRNPDDGRALALLGEAYVARRWFSQAVRKYQTLLRRHPEMGAEPDVRAGILELVAVETTSGQATSLAVRVIGADLAADAERMRDQEEDEERRGRLQRLLDRLAGG